MPVEKNIPDNDENLITPEEKAFLDESFNLGTGADDINQKRSQLDNTDDDGDLLNEQSSGDDISGADLDIPGADEDDLNEDIGEEDEENNGYSEADTE